MSLDSSDDGIRNQAGIYRAMGVDNVVTIASDATPPALTETPANENELALAAQDPAQENVSVDESTPLLRKSNNGF